MSERLLTNHTTKVDPSIRINLEQAIVPFSQEVDQIKTATQFEIKPWYLLPNTGFNVALQVNQFMADLQKSGNNREAFNSDFQKVEQDILGFKTEYLCEGLLFPIVLKRQIVGGEEKIVGGLYADKPLENTVDSQERHGTVKNSVIKVADFLKTAPRSSIAVLTSPEGWSGLTGPNGRAINYADSQTYIWRVMEDGTPMGFTVRTDMNLEQSKKLLIHFGKDPQNLQDQHSDISQITNAPVFLPALPGANTWQFEDVVNVIKTVKGSPFAYKNRSFDEVYNSLQNPEALWTLDETTKELTDQLKSFLQEKLELGTLTRQDVEIAIGATVLKLAAKIRPQFHSSHNAEHKVDPSIRINLNAPIFGAEKPMFRPIHPWDYLALLKDVQKLPGCNGGGDENTMFNGTISARYALAEKTLNCKCPFCNMQVDAIISMGKIICPKCDKSAPYKC